jgi:hypothetical protein
MDRCSPNQVFAHDGELLFRSGCGSLDRGDLAEPALFLGFRSRSMRLAWIPSSRGI